MVDERVQSELKRPEAAVSGRLRILSANLWNGRADAAAFAALVERVDADLVAVQELSHAQAEALARVRPHGVLEPHAHFQGMGVASRVPIAVRRLALPCRDARIAEVQLDGPDGPVAVEVVNIHVQAPHSLPTWGTVQRRRGQWRGLERHLRAAPHHPRVVVGDFNATPLWPFYRRMAHHLQDAAALAARRQGRRPGATWGPWAGATRLLRIDHAFVHRLAVHDFQVHAVTGGDHAAIVVDVSLAERR